MHKSCQEKITSPIIVPSESSAFDLNRRLFICLVLLLSLFTPTMIIPFVGTAIRAAIGSPRLRTMEEEPGSPEFWYKVIISIVLVLAGGVFAGCVRSVFVVQDSYRSVSA